MRYAASPDAGRESPEDGTGGRAAVYTAGPQRFAKCTKLDNNMGSGRCHRGDLVQARHAISGGVIRTRGQYRIKRVLYPVPHDFIQRMPAIRSLRAHSIHVF